MPKAPVVSEAEILLHQSERALVQTQPASPNNPQGVSVMTRCNPPKEGTFLCVQQAQLLYAKNELGPQAVGERLDVMMLLKLLPLINDLESSMICNITVTCGHCVCAISVKDISKLNVYCV